MNNLRSLLKSFKYAFSGLVYCVKYERNFRIHLVIAMFVMYISRFYDLTKLEMIMLVFSVGLVISMEMINTAIEASIDLQAPMYNNIAKIVKDVSAGAVLVTALVSISIAVGLFWEPEVLMNILEIHVNNSKYAMMFLCGSVLSAVFIFVPTNILNRQKKIRSNKKIKK